MQIIKNISFLLYIETTSSIARIYKLFVEELACKGSQGNFKIDHFKANVAAVI